jgi:hypothetical protein
MIAHHRHPSGRTRHMDLQYFATQEWVQQGTMTFFKNDGTANPSDAMSKVLYRILHRRNFDHLQGYYGPPTPHTRLFALTPTIIHRQVDCSPLHIHPFIFHFSLLFSKLSIPLFLLSLMS